MAVKVLAQHKQCMRHDTQIHQRFVYLIWPPSILACCHGYSYITVRVWKVMVWQPESGVAAVLYATWHGFASSGFTLSISCLLLSFCSLDELTLWQFCSVGDHSVSFLALEYDSIQSEDIKHVWLKPELILKHICFIFHVSLSNKAHISAWSCCVWKELKGW